jgi:serine/threonine protein kinase
MLIVTVGLLGTPGYMSPEQADPSLGTSTLDVYSLGAVLYALLTDNSPFDAEKWHKRPLEKCCVIFDKTIRRHQALRLRSLLRLRMQLPRPAEPSLASWYTSYKRFGLITMKALERIVRVATEPHRNWQRISNGIFKPARIGATCQPKLPPA